MATVPIGYGDGYRRALTNKAYALLHGRQIPLIGTVSMDNVTFDAGEHGLGADARATTSCCSAPRARSRSPPRTSRR